MKPRLGWLGPALVVLGAAVAVVAGWWVVHARPRAGRVLDVVPLAPDAAFVLRAEDGGDRSFVELRTAAGELRWQALIPRYAGRPGAPGLAWGDRAVTVRVIRNGRPEVFALSIRDASKLGGFRLAPDRPAAADGYSLAAAVTLGDGARAFELVGGPGWSSLIGVDLATGKALWRAELGAGEVTGATLAGGAVVVTVGGARRGFDPRTGAAVAPPADAAPAAVRSEAPAAPAAPGALPRQPYHLAGATLWVPFPDHVEARPSQAPGAGAL